MSPAPALDLTHPGSCRRLKNASLSFKKKIYKYIQDAEWFNAHILIFRLIFYLKGRVIGRRDEKDLPFVGSAIKWIQMAPSSSSSWNWADLSQELLAS